MDLSEMLGLSLKQGLLLVGSGLVLAAVIAAWAFVRRTREEPQHGLRLDDR
jgi:hypothetical protein